MVGIRIHLKVAVAEPEKLVHLKPIDPSILHTISNLHQTSVFWKYFSWNHELVQLYLIRQFKCRQSIFYIICGNTYLCIGMNFSIYQVFVISSYSTFHFTEILQKSLGKSKSSVIRTVWKLRKFTATILSPKFRGIIFLLKNFTLNWFDEKKFAWQ